MFLFLAMTSTLFLCVFLWRMFLKSGQIVTAKIISVSEGRLELLNTNGFDRYYFPILKYEFEYNNVSVIHQIGENESRLYREEELSALGDKRPDKDYFWRHLAPGDEIQCRVRGNKKSTLAGKINRKIVSEDYVFLVLSLIILFVAILIKFVG